MTLATSAITLTTLATSPSWVPLATGVLGSSRSKPPWSRSPTEPLLLPHTFKGALP